MTEQGYGGKSAQAYRDEHARLTRLRFMRAFPHLIVDRMMGRSNSYPLVRELESQASTRRDQPASYSNEYEMTKRLIEVTGVDERHATAIYNEFGSIEEVLKSPIERLATVRVGRGRIGRSLADKIVTRLRVNIVDAKP